MSPQNKDADVQAEESGEATKMTLDGDESSADEETDIVSPASDYSKYSYKAVLAQGLMATVALLITASNGMTAGYPALLLPQLQSENSTLPTTEEEGSWITSIHSIMTPIGSLLTGPIMERIGRRTTLLMSILPGVLGWLCISFSWSHATLLVGRSLTGLATGLSAAPAMVLLGEIAEPRLRGLLVGAPSTTFSIGILLIYALSSALPWQKVAAVAIILPLCALVAFFFLPESPLWLARMGKTEEALKGLTWLRGGSEEQARHELNVLKEQQLHNKMVDEACSRSRQRSALLSRPVLRALLVVNVFNFFQIMAGTFTIIFYAVNVLQQATGGQVSDTQVAIVTALTRVILTGIACALLLHCGRRPLTISSGIGSGAAAIVLSGWLYWAPDSEYGSWVPAALVVIFVIFNSYGFFMVQGLMLGEMLPARARGQSSGITCAIINAMLFVTSKTFPWMTHVLKPHGLFLLFGLMTVAGTVFAYLFVPETKGRTLAEIEGHFSGPSLFWNSDQNVLVQEESIINEVESAKS